MVSPKSSAECLHRAWIRCLHIESRNEDLVCPSPQRHHRRDYHAVELPIQMNEEQEVDAPLLIVIAIYISQCLWQQLLYFVYVTKILRYLWVQRSYVVESEERCIFRYILFLRMMSHIVFDQDS